MCPVWVQTKTTETYMSNTGCRSKSHCLMWGIEALTASASQMRGTHCMERKHWMEKRKAQSFQQRMGWLTCCTQSVLWALQ